jgi:hypothetical protein
LHHKSDFDIQHVLFSVLSCTAWKCALAANSEQNSVCVETIPKGNHLLRSGRKPSLPCVLSARGRITEMKAHSLVLVFATCALFGCQAKKISEKPKESPPQDLHVTSGGFIENHPERGTLHGVCESDATRNVLNCDIHNGLLDWTVTEITIGVTWSPYKDDDKGYFRERVSIEPLMTSRVSVRLGLQLPPDDVVKPRGRPPKAIKHWSWLVAEAKGVPLQNSATPDNAELKKEIIVGCIAAIATAIPAALLFWWTWKRDQERIIVKKVIPHSPTLTDQSVPEKDEFGPVFNILITNRSLFPIYLSAFGVSIDGEVIVLESPLLPVKMKANPDPYSNRPNIADADSDPREILSQKSTTVERYANRAKVASTLTRAAERHNTSAETILTSSKVFAIVLSQARNEFTSESFRHRIWRTTKTRLKRRPKT